MSFSASYDRTTAITSAVVCRGLLAVILAVHSLILTCLSIFVLLLCFAYSPRGYTIADRCIVVQRLAGPARNPLDQVREVRRATSDDFRGCIRLAGSGGLFGYCGLFSTTRLGRSTWYVTNRSNSVVLITGTKTVLFSPDDPDAFLTTLRAYAPVSISSAPVPARPFGALWKVAAIALALVGMGFGIAAFNYSPGVPSYTLTPESLTIHDRLYPVTLPASSVDVANIRVVDLARDPDWRPTLRTDGFANSHYESGWFQMASGQKVRLYRADGRNAVLIPAKGSGTPVLYQAEDPDKFADAVRAAWGTSATAQ